jgi:hypothetical protein
MLYHRTGHWSFFLYHRRNHPFVVGKISSQILAFKLQHRFTPDHIAVITYFLSMLNPLHD